jgi:hypothetical protein
MGVEGESDSIGYFSTVRLLSFFLLNFVYVSARVRSSSLN